MGRKRSGAVAVKDDTSEDPCPLNKKKDSLCLMSERAAREKSWTEKEYLSVKGPL